ncbi:MAG TPA: response regulator transcription factor [Acidimicrobiales bacterium]|nr:response regulator transcription factor [Acidimicrobiales bacterium]
MRILLADDDAELTTMLQSALDRTGHAVDVVATGEEALWLAGACEYDALILDVNLPASDGFTVCQELRTGGDWTPILFLTGRTAVADRVAGLDAGGDDYLAKPFALEELTARLRTISRRQPRQRPTVLEAGDVEIDPAARSVRRASTELDLAPKEFALLELLVRHAGEVVERKRIHDALWDFAFDPRSNVIEAVVRRLRVRIDLPSRPSYIDTVRGVGYRFRPF